MHYGICAFTIECHGQGTAGSTGCGKGGYVIQWGSQSGSSSQILKGKEWCASIREAGGLFIIVHTSKEQE